MTEGEPVRPTARGRPDSRDEEIVDMDYDELAWLGGLIVGLLAGLSGATLFWSLIGLVNAF